MIREANKHRRDVEFAVGDKVFVKFRPFRQRTLFRSMNTKLAPRFFGPFEVEARIGAVAYRLKLSGTARVHPVFHVSLLKSSMGVNSVEPTLPDELLGDDPLFIPEKVLARREIERNGKMVPQVLIKWVDHGDDEVVWLDTEETRMDTHFERMEHRLEMMEKGLDEVCTKFSTIETMFAAIMKEKEKEKSSDSRTSQTSHETDTSQTMNHTTTLSGTPKIDLPSFDGSDPIAWIARAEQFFLVHHTRVAEKVPIALVAMSGDALYWVQGLMRRFPTIAWPQFIEELLFRFSTLTTVNAYEALKVTRQTDSVDEYIAEFEACVAQVTDLSDPHYLGQFLGGLREDIRIRIRDDPSMNMYAAIRLARQVERELNFANFPSGLGFSLFSRLSSDVREE
ncbi:Unknown protein [Striga hermonthica]|uniref:Retrotransposon gag domain-containing protein n=1 Tax=Striga hermonthica TaxID=68872 RepID=A0A9N7N1I8_STRHE|nr:Unknown protein [Striga hermonthica]